MEDASSRLRAKLISGLRDLADYLADHPEIPAPLSVDVMVFPPRGTDAAMRAAIDGIAAMLGTRATDDDGHYQASRRFGPVAYQAVAISAKRRARYAAWESCRDAVTPDSSTER